MIISNIIHFVLCSAYSYNVLCGVLIITRPAESRAVKGEITNPPLRPTAYHSSDLLPHPSLMKTGHGYRPFCQAFYHRPPASPEKKGNNTRCHARGVYENLTVQYISCIIIIMTLLRERSPSDRPFDLQRKIIILLYV